MRRGVIEQLGVHLAARQGQTPALSDRFFANVVMDFILVGCIFIPVNIVIRLRNGSALLSKFCVYPLCLKD